MQYGIQVALAQKEPGWVGIMTRYRLLGFSDQVPPSDQYHRPGSSPEPEWLVSWYNRDWLARGGI